jgi:hypothetical protein
VPTPTRPLQHQTPTHADTEDRYLFGLTGRQFLIAVLALILAYGAWDGLGPGWPFAPRAALAVAVAVIGLALAFLRPGGRSLGEYFFVRLRAAIMPRVTVWRPAGRD